MPHGAPDWYGYRRTSKTHPLGDLAEHAVRLGAINSFDRRGDIAFIDSFEYGLQKWNQITGGAGANIEITPQYCLHGGYSIELTGGSDGSCYACIEHHGALLPTNQIGVEVAFSLASLIDQIHLQLITYDGTSVRNTVVRFNDVGNLLESYQGGGVFPLIHAVTPTPRNSYSFNHLKYVFNPITGHYVRAIFNNTEYDISQHTYHTIGSALAPCFIVYVWLYSRAANNDIAYIDNLIVTQDEP